MLQTIYRVHTLLGTSSTVKNPTMWAEKCLVFFHFICNETETVLDCKGHEWNLTIAKGIKSPFEREVWFSASGPYYNAAERYWAGRHTAPGWGVQTQSTKPWLSPQYFQFHHSSQMWEVQTVTKRQAWKWDSGLYIHLSPSDIHLQRVVK